MNVINQVKIVDLIQMIQKSSQRLQRLDGANRRVREDTLAANNLVRHPGRHVNGLAIGGRNLIILFPALNQAKNDFHLLSIQRVTKIENLDFFAARRGTDIIRKLPGMTGSKLVTSS